MKQKIKMFDGAVDSLQKGVNVVEASAGTGKTFSIAMLVLRFVAEFGVPVEQLLVVTFTKAATEELRSRIRKRLVEGRDFLKEGTASDETLVRCLSQLPDKNLARQRLELALLDMDQAAVFTIHGFCQRMLREQALESGQLFDVELTADIGKIREELVEDYWRRQLYALSSLHCSLFLASFPDPESLYDSVRGVGPLDVLEPDDRTLPQDLLRVMEEDLQRLAHWWQEYAEKLESCFCEAVAGNYFKKRLRGEFVSWWQKCNLFFSGISRQLPPDLGWLSSERLVDELNGSKLRGDAKKQAYLAGWPLAEGLVETFLASCEAAVLSLRIHLALDLRAGLRERLARQGRFSFDDLVLLLAKALEEKEGGELQAILGRRYQVALIDEFQDTDAAQYRIFSTLFGTGRHYLYLIGDPKQAIYKFRGADIFAYFTAKESADQLLGLAKNYRSNPLLVEAINTLFLGKTNSFVFPELPYQKVTAALPSTAMQLLINEAVQPGMMYCCLEPTAEGNGRWTSAKCCLRIESYVRDEIAMLLGNGYLQVDEEGKRRVTANDIAILVRTHKQAEEFQDILAASAIPAVISSRKSVFAGRECRDLFFISQAVASPGDATVLRTALSCRWFGLDGVALYALSYDERQMDEWMARFYDYHRLWQEKGFFVMMDRLLVDERVFQTLTDFPLAERQMGNIMHLLELIQEAEDGEHLGMTQTLQYITSMMEELQGEDAELRLESDKKAVQIVTMHGVKGLEYPIVFCPFLWYRSGRLKGEKQCLSCHDEGMGKVTDLGSADFSRRKELALEEELAEDVRLLYVALTRASCRCYSFWADVKGSRFVSGSENSAFCWLVTIDTGKTVTEQLAEISDGQTAELMLLAAEDLSVEKGAVFSNVREALCCREFSRSALSAEWLLSSYSALAGQTHNSIFRRDVGNDTVLPRDESPSVAELPFGASFGNVVHGLLEDVAFGQLAKKNGYKSDIASQCRRFGVVAEEGILMGMLADVTCSPLAGNDQKPFVLADLASTDVLKEMPFYYHLQDGSTAVINNLLGAVATVRDIQERELKGYLTGFVDLICRCDDRYYIMDYKTNYLGERYADYEPEKLTAAMRDHNYGLQYWIYTLVLHRYLQNSLPSYRYERDFGGVFYLFVRGMRPDMPGNGVFYDCPDPHLLGKLHASMGGR